MQINITGHNMEITPVLKQFALDKLTKLERHCHKIISINVILDIEKFIHIAEATVLVDHITLHASAESENMYTSIDLLIEKLDIQLMKHKHKTMGHRE